MPAPPYGVIWDELKTGMVVPFLGAGASLADRDPTKEWKDKNSPFLPSGGELAEFLAKKTNLPSKLPEDRKDLAKVSSYFTDMNGRSRLKKKLREVFTQKNECGALHKFLASNPVPQLIVVTNYDTLLEQAFKDSGKPYDLVIYPADNKNQDNANAVLWWEHGKPEPHPISPNELLVDLESRSVIFKMHGTIVHDENKWDNFVITEEDYVEFLSRMTANTAIPAQFQDHFKERSFLFLGYSLRDWNLRVLLKNLSKHFESRQGDNDHDDEPLPSWAIQQNPPELESSLWVKRGVNIFNINLEEFVTKLQEERDRN